MPQVRENRTNNCAVVQRLCAERGNPGQLTRMHVSEVVGAALLYGIPEATARTVVSRWNRYGTLGIRKVRALRKQGIAEDVITKAIQESGTL